MSEIPRPRLPETPSPKEAALNTVTPVVARIVDDMHIRGKQDSFDRLNNASLESRHAYYRGDRDSFDEKNRKWNEKLWNWIQDETKPEEDLSDVRIQTLNSVGIDAFDDRRTAIGLLNANIENFRQKYLAKDSSDAGQFVEDIAKGCETRDGTVDLNQLTMRLESIREMLIIFGKHRNINILVEEYALSHGLDMQGNEHKQDISEKIAEQRNYSLSSQEKVRLAAVGIDTEPPTQEIPIIRPDDDGDDKETVEDNPPIEYFIEKLKEKMPDEESASGPNEAMISVNKRDKEKEDSMLLLGDFMIALDGVGGTVGDGNTAKAARNFLEHQVKRMPKDMELDETKKWIKELVVKTNEHLLELQAHKDAPEIGATTLALVYNWQNKEQLCVSVGDSSIYTYKDKKLYPLIINPDIQKLAYDMLCIKNFSESEPDGSRSVLDLVQLAKEYHLKLPKGTPEALGLNQPLTEEEWKLVHDLFAQHEDLPHIYEGIVKRTGEGKNAARDLYQESLYLQRKFNNITGHVEEVDLGNGRKGNKFVYTDGKSDKPANPQLVALFKKRETMKTALGTKDMPEPTITSRRIKGEDVIMMLACTDGLDDNLTQDEIEKILAQVDLENADEASLARVVRSLAETAKDFSVNEFGENPRAKIDDITVGLKRVKGNPIDHLEVLRAERGIVSEMRDSLDDILPTDPQETFALMQQIEEYRRDIKENMGEMSGKDEYEWVRYLISSEVKDEVKQDKLRAVLKALYDKDKETLKDTSGRTEEKEDNTDDIIDAELLPHENKEATQQRQQDIHDAQIVTDHQRAIEGPKKDKENDEADEDHQKEKKDELTQEADIEAEEEQNLDSAFAEITKGLPAGLSEDEQFEKLEITINAKYPAGSLMHTNMLKMLHDKYKREKSESTNDKAENRKTPKATKDGFARLARRAKASALTQEDLDALPDEDPEKKRSRVRITNELAAETVLKELGLEGDTLRETITRITEELKNKDQTVYVRALKGENDSINATLELEQREQK